MCTSSRPFLVRVPHSAAAVLLLLATYFLPPQAACGTERLLKNGDRVAIVGDSITEQKMYSRMIETYLLACVPDLEVTVFQFGWGGETAPGFANRMENDFVPWAPNVVTTCFGMNDGAYRPYDDQIGKRYEDGTRRIQARVKQLNARMVVGGPGVVDTDTFNRADPQADKMYNANLAKLSEIAGRVAAENGFVYADVHAIMLDTMNKAKAALGPEYHVAGSDGIHPAQNGHLVMAYAFLKALGFDGTEIGTIEIDLAGTTTATEGHRVISARNGNVSIESTVYPFCFGGGDKLPDHPRSILPFLPFNRELNRYMLKVRNMSTPKADVTWGNATRTFSKAELETGVNLAEVFPENPFCAPFGVVQHAVWVKQSRETWIVKGMIAQFRTLKNDFAGDGEVVAATDTLRRKLFERHQAADAATARASVKPVRHTITIIPRKQD